MKQKSEKVLAAEKWVDQYVSKNKIAPTYAELAKGLGISRTAAYSRCIKFRNKMQVENPDIAIAIKYIRVKLDIMVPKERFEEFSIELSKINKLLLP